MDVKSAVRGRGTAKREPSTLEIRQCRYCKGKFEVDPKFPHKMFCCESHRKLYWRYGSQSIGKVAQRIERDMRKLIEREQRPVLAELTRLRARLDALENPGPVDPEANEPACIDWDAIDAARRALEAVKRGGGAGA